MSKLQTETNLQKSKKTFISNGADRPSASHSDDSMGVEKIQMASQMKLNNNSKKYIYHFGPEGTEGSVKDKHLLGNKGANLAEMSCLGLQVPPGFTLTTEFCSLFLKADGKFPSVVVKTPVAAAVKRLEKVTGKKFGDTKKPLAVECAIRGFCQYAGHNGHHFKFRSE